MKKRIYRNMCLVTLVAILFSAILTSFLYYQNLEKQMRQELVTEAKYLEAGMDLSGEYCLIIWQMLLRWRTTKTARRSRWL